MAFHGLCTGSTDATSQCHSALRLGLGDTSDQCWHSLEIKDLDNASSSIAYLRALPDVGVSW